MKKLKFEDLILFETPEVIVINKPPFISSLDERSGEGDSILRLAKAHYEELQLCHRLDKETSGAMVIAKNPETYRHISMEFEHKRVLKKYHAVVEGNVDFQNLEVDLPIGKGKGGLMRIDYSEGKEAITYFTSLKFYRHYTLMQCIPITGRTHQIRIHLATQRTSISGDVAYGGKLPYLSQLKRKYNYPAEEEERAMMNRVALHAHAIKLNYGPELQLEVTAPYPKDFEVFVKQLDRYDQL